MTFFVGPETIQETIVDAAAAAPEARVLAASRVAARELVETDNERSLARGQLGSASVHAGARADQSTMTDFEDDLHYDTDDSWDYGDRPIGQKRRTDGGDDTPGEAKILMKLLQLPNEEERLSLSAVIQSAGAVGVTWWEVLATRGVGWWLNLTQEHLNEEYAVLVGIALENLRLCHKHVSLYELLSAMGKRWSESAGIVREAAQRYLCLLHVHQEVALRLADAHGDVQTLTVENLLRSGASLLVGLDGPDVQQQQLSGKTLAHMAVLFGNEDLFSTCLQHAPMSLLMEDDEGFTPLDVMEMEGFLAGRSDPSLQQAVRLAALDCIAVCPEQMMALCRKRGMAMCLITLIADSLSCKVLRSFVYEAMTGNASHPVDVAAEARKVELAQEHEERNSRVHLRERARRVALLTTLARDRQNAAAALDPEENRLRAEHAEEVVRQVRAESARRIDELEAEVERLRALCKKQEQEILVLKSVPSAPALPQDAEIRSAPLAVPASSKAAAGKEKTGKRSSKPASAERQDECRSPSDPPDGFRAEAETAERSRERRVIEEIARRRGIGSDESSVATLPDEVRHSVSELRKSLAAAVNTIAKDVFESEAHFMQELLQNADDNRYDADAVPEVAFLFLKSSVKDGGGVSFMAVNNEAGFSEKDVLSITDISRSSKAASSSSTTGCKGVGWKSVFRVCSEPIVLSKGWRFKFGGSGLGMLTPQWLADAEYRKLPAEVQTAHAAGRTVFWLRLTDSHSVSSIEAEMQAMETDPARLLFLRRVRKIELQRLSGDVVRMACDQDEAVITTCRKGGSSAGLQSHQVHFHVQKYGEATVAMPLHNSNPPPQGVFAFLPIRPVGFCFAAQAPFHLTTSRSDLHRSAWNAKVRDDIAPAFLQACAANEDVASSGLRFLGSPPNDPFWFDVRDDILKGLRQVCCIATEDGVLGEPGKCLLRGESPVSQWISRSLLFAACGLRFVAAHQPQDSMKALGVGTFDAEHLIACLSCSAGAAWLEELWQSASRQAAYSDIYAALADALQQDFSCLETVAKLRIFPVEVGAGVDVPLFACAADNVFAEPCEDFPVAWQEHLLQFISSELLLELTLAGKALLELLNVPSASVGVLEQAALETLVDQGKIAKTTTYDQRVSCWAALYILQRCFLTGRKPPRPWEEIRGAVRLPAANDTLLPPDVLQPWSFMGITIEWPLPVAETIRKMANWSQRVLRGTGKELLGPGHLQQVEPPRPFKGCARTAPAHLNWEIFLHGLGCSPITVTSMSSDLSMEVAAKLGESLANGSSWRTWAESPATMDYIELQILKASRPQREWLQRLPVWIGGVCYPLHDLFLRDVFHRLAGDLLPYVDRAPGSERVRKLLAMLGVSVAVDGPAILKALQHFRIARCNDSGAYADLYAELGKQGFACQMDWLFVPGHGCVSAARCAWRSFKEPLLRPFCQLHILSEQYERFGPDVCLALRGFVDDADENVAELVHALRQLVEAAKGNRVRTQLGLVDSPIPRPEALAGLTEVAKGVVEKLAHLYSVTEDLPRSAVQDLAIVVPEGQGFRVLSASNAYWTVPPGHRLTPLGELALDVHFGHIAGARYFFCDILEVAEVHRPPDRQSNQNWSRPTPLAQRRPEALPGLPGSVVEGLSVKYTNQLVPVQQQPPPPPSGACPAQPQADPQYFPQPHEAQTGQTDANGQVARQSGRQQQAEPQPAREAPRPSPEPVIMDPLQEALLRASSVPAFTPGLEKSIPEPPPSTRPPRHRRCWCRVHVEQNGTPLYAADVPQIPFVLPPGLGSEIVHLIRPIFNVEPRQVALAYDASGRCVSEAGDLLLDYGRGVRIAQIAQRNSSAVPVQTVLAYWVAEFAHAVAHLQCGPEHDDRFIQLQAELLSWAMPLAMQAWQQQAMRWQSGFSSAVGPRMVRDNMASSSSHAPRFWPGGWPV